MTMDITGTNDTRPGPSTRCVHAGTNQNHPSGSVIDPICTSTVYRFPNTAGINTYPRYFNTPNQDAVGRKIAALEHGEAGIVFGSGMAAITTVLFAHLGQGDHAVFQEGLYGGTQRLVSHTLKRSGIETSAAGSVEEFEAQIRPNTRVLYLESPTNPLLRCIDLSAIADLGRRCGLTTVIDNTFATPVNQNPLAAGLDVVIHSATKYLNGHSDLNAGAAVSTSERIDLIRHHALDIGGMLDARTSDLLDRGIKTLALRMARHNENGARVAEFLVGHPSVSRVHYPGLQTHPDHEIARRQMSGYGGMVTFELLDSDQANRFLAHLKLVAPALSLGGVESLACIPARTSHRDLSKLQRQQQGIADGLVRLSIGIEDPDDLIHDIRQALDHV